MKLRLLKPLPGAEVGTILESEEPIKGAVTISIGDTVNTYDISTLVSTGWAEGMPERWEPKLRETYYELNFYGPNFHPISECKSFENIEAVKHRAKYGMAAETREELEITLELLRLRQTNGGWVPSYKDTYYTVLIDNIISSELDNMSIDMQRVLSGNCYRTREEAEKYAPEWKALFDKMKARGSKN